MANKAEAAPANAGRLLPALPLGPRMPDPLPSPNALSTARSGQSTERLSLGRGATDPTPRGRSTVLEGTQGGAPTPRTIAEEPREEPQPTARTAARVETALRALRGWLDTPRNAQSVQSLFREAQEPGARGVNVAKLVAHVASLAAASESAELEELWSPKAGVETAALAKALAAYAGKHSGGLIDLHEFSRLIAKACAKGWGRKAVEWSSQNSLVQRLGERPGPETWGRSCILSWSVSAADLGKEPGFLARNAAPGLQRPPPTPTRRRKRGYRHDNHSHNRVPKSKWTGATHGLQGGDTDHPAAMVGYTSSVRAPSFSFGGTDGRGKLGMAPEESLVHAPGGLVGRPKIGWHGLDPCYTSGREAGASYIYPEVAPGSHNISGGAQKARLRVLEKSPHWSINSRDLRIKVFRPIADINTGASWTKMRSAAEISGFTLPREMDAPPGPDHYVPAKLADGALPGTGMPRGAQGEVHPANLMRTAGRGEGLGATLADSENVGRTVGLPFTGTKAMGVNWDAATMFQFNGVPGPGKYFGPAEYKNRIAGWQQDGNRAAEAPAASLHSRPAPHENYVVPTQLATKTGLRFASGGLHYSYLQAPAPAQYEPRQLRAGSATSIAAEAAQPGNAPTMEPRRHPAGLVPTQLPIAGGHMPESKLFAPCPGEFGARLGVDPYSLERTAGRLRDEPGRAWLRAGTFPGTTPLKLGATLPEEAGTARMSDGQPHPSSEMGTGERFDTRGVRGYEHHLAQGTGIPEGSWPGPAAYFPTHAPSGDAAMRTGFAEALREHGTSARIGVGVADSLKGYEFKGYETTNNTHADAKPENALVYRTAPVVNQDAKDGLGRFERSMG